LTSICDFFLPNIVFFSTLIEGKKEMKKINTHLKFVLYESISKTSIERIQIEYSTWFLIFSTTP